MSLCGWGRLFLDSLYLSNEGSYHSSCQGITEVRGFPPSNVALLRIGPQAYFPKGPQYGCNVFEVVLPVMTVDDHIVQENSHIFYVELQESIHQPLEDCRGPV